MAGDLCSFSVLECTDDLLSPETYMTQNTQKERVLGTNISDTLKGDIKDILKDHDLQEGIWGEGS